MTVSLERSVRPVPPTGVCSMVDPFEETHAVLTLRVAVTRDHLAAALDMAASHTYGRQDADSWTVEQIRNWTEASIALMDCLELQLGGESMARLAAGPVDGDASVLELAQAVYRAVDRAYPGLRESAP